MRNDDDIAAVEQNIEEDPNSSINFMDYCVEESLFLGLQNRTRATIEAERPSSHQTNPRRLTPKSGGKLDLLTETYSSLRRWPLARNQFLLGIGSYENQHKMRQYKNIYSDVANTAM